MHTTHCPRLWEPRELPRVLPACPETFRNSRTTSRTQTPGFLAAPPCHAARRVRATRARTAASHALVCARSPCCRGPRAPRGRGAACAPGRVIPPSTRPRALVAPCLPRARRVQASGSCNQPPRGCSPCGAMVGLVAGRGQCFLRGAAGCVAGLGVMTGGALSSGDAATMAEGQWRSATGSMGMALYRVGGGVRGAASERV